jgi:predicted CXXCH cytochrome family protein
VNLRTMARAGVAAAWLLTARSGLTGTLAGTAHDFSTTAWGGSQVCVACHTPHNANSAGNAPLWNHTVTTQTYTLYTSSSLTATMAQPTVGDKLCLSCHDGTVAVDSYRGSLGMVAPTGTTLISAANKLGTNLNVHHPSSFLYDAALATANGSLWDPTTKVVTVGAGAQQKTGPVSAVMLSGGQVQCSSCHDVHNTYTNPGATKLLKMSMARSAMCFACHNY